MIEKVYINQRRIPNEITVDNSEIYAEIKQIKKQVDNSDIHTELKQIKKQIDTSDIHE